MSLENDITEIKKILEAKVEVAEPETVPETIPTEPERRPQKPVSPLKQVPGITPKPKAFNTDVELFLRKRGIAENRLKSGRVLEDVVVQKAISKSHDFPIGIFWYDFSSNKLYYNPYSEGLHHSKTPQYNDVASNDQVLRGRIFKDGEKNVIVIYEGDFKTSPLRQIDLNNLINQVQEASGVTVNYIVNEVGENLLEKKKRNLNVGEKVEEAKPLAGVHPEKKKWIETGDDQLNQILPRLSDTEQSYLQTIASEEYANTVAKVEQYTGIKVKPSNLPSLAYLLMQTLTQVQAIEKRHTRNLEETALELVFSIPEFKVVEESYMNDEIGFDLKIAPAELGRLKSKEEEAPEEGLSPDEKLNFSLANMFQNESEENIRRRFANLLTSGGSINKLYLFNMAADKLSKIDPNLPNYYGILAAVAQIGYYVTPFGIEQTAMEGEQTSAGSEEVVPKGDKYIIKVRGVTFPYLVHELVKGIYEYLSMDQSQQIAMRKDKAGDETKDIIAGPGVYKAVMSYIPAEKQELMPIIQKKLTALKPDQIKDVIAQNFNGKKIMDQFIVDAEKELGTYRKEKEEYVK